MPALLAAMGHTGGGGWRGIVLLELYQVSIHNHAVLAVVVAIVRHLKLTQQTVIIGE